MYDILYKKFSSFGVAYLIPKSFHPLLKRISKLVGRVRLGEFWSGFWRRYGHAVLEQSQVEWIIKVKNEGVLKNEDIANAQGISISRVQQLYRAYRKSGAIPVLKRAGRPRSPDVPPGDRDIVKHAFERFRMCACYLEKVIQFHYGIKSSQWRSHGSLGRSWWSVN